MTTYFILSVIHVAASHLHLVRRATDECYPIDICRAYLIATKFLSVMTVLLRRDFGCLVIMIIKVGTCLINQN